MAKTAIKKSQMARLTMKTLDICLRSSLLLYTTKHTRKFITRAARVMKNNDKAKPKTSTLDRKPINVSLGIKLFLFSAEKLFCFPPVLDRCSEIQRVNDLIKVDFPMFRQLPNECWKTFNRCNFVESFMVPTVLLSGLT